MSFRGRVLLPPPLPRLTDTRQQVWPTGPGHWNSEKNARVLD
ncbi:hypothetical protein BTB1458_0527 [Mycobacterium tuberculosis]|nr:hypothetical protein BTB1458_0527 [Mycobacterium tuberculosis]